MLSVTPPSWFGRTLPAPNALRITSVGSLDFHVVHPSHRVERVPVHFLNEHLGTCEGIYMWRFRPSNNMASLAYYVGETSRLSISRLHQYVEEVFALNQNRFDDSPHTLRNANPISGNGGGWNFRYINHDLENLFYSTPPGTHGVDLFVRSKVCGLTRQQDETQTRIAGLAAGADVRHRWPTMTTEIATPNSSRRYILPTWAR